MSKIFSARLAKKVSFVFYVFNNGSNFSTQFDFGSKTEDLSRKLPSAAAESFPISIFLTKPNMRDSIYTNIVNLKLSCDSFYLCFY